MQSLEKEDVDEQSSNNPYGFVYKGKPKKFHKEEKVMKELVLDLHVK